MVMNIRKILFLFFSSLLFGQISIDKDIYCSRNQTVARWLSGNTTVTENQQKIDITYYNIDLEIDLVLEEIYGSVVVNGSVGLDQPDSIELDFSNDMSVDSIKFNDQAWDFLHQDNILSIPPPYSDAIDGYDFSFEIFYHGHPTSTGFGSFNFDEYAEIDHVWTLSEPYGSRDWWPCKDDPSDKADSVDIIITVPDEQIAVSNGILLDVEDLGDGRKKYHWSERYPICTYLVSVTTYPYTVWYDQYIGLEGDTLPLEYYVYPDHYNLVYDNYMLTNDMMRVFAEKFGEYPFMNEKYGHVEFGRGGGMEHQTITSLGGYSQWLIAHELGHQWWGDLVTCASFHHIWLNEGFARFSEALWEEANNGPNAYRQYWQSHAYYGPGTIYVEEPNTASQIFNGNLTYNKAGWVVHMLRGVMGDSLFFQTLQSYGYNDSLAYGAVTTENFQAVCEDISNLDLEQFFQQWIYGEYYPQYGFFWEMNNSNELIVTILQMQSWQFFNMPINLRVMLPDDTLNFTVYNEGQSQEFNLGVIDGSPYLVTLDPDDWILKEVEYMNLKDILPSENSLTFYPVYPNPFNPRASIQIFVPDQLGEMQSSISIFDIKGSLIDRISLGKLQPGMNKTSWSGKYHATGIYFIQLDADDKIYTQKIQLIK